MVGDRTVRATEVPRLLVELPDGKEVHHPVAVSEITIGRDPSNRICISDHYVSKFHAKLFVEKNSMTLVDLESANKTYVNGRPIDKSPVRYGDEIQFAGVRCRLLGPESEERKEAKPAAAATPPPAAKAEPPAAPAAKAPVSPRAAPKPAGKAKPPKAKGRSSPPPVEADPMKRLLIIGGILIFISLVLGIVLRLLLVPSESPTETAATPSTTIPPAVETAATSTVPPVEPSVPEGERTAEYYFDEALSHLDTGRLKQAQASFKKVLELEPDNTRAQTRLSLLEEEIENKAERHFTNARQAFQFLRYEEAIAEWEMFLLLADPADARYGEAQQGIQQAKAKLR